MFCGSQDRHLYALNPDGTQKWSFTFRQIPPTDAAIGRDGTVYIEGDGILYAFSAAGIQKWAFTNYSSEIGSASPVIGPDETI